MTPVEKVLAALPGRYKAAGHRKWKTACPAHGSDNIETLSIAEGEDGTVLLKCFAHGCTVDAIAESIGLKVGDLFPEKLGNLSSLRSYKPPPMTEKRPALGANEPASAPGPSLFTLTRADQIQSKPIDWLIRGYLVKDTLAGLIAPAGACKSFLAIDWACRVATGTDWYGRSVQRGAVFYLAGEGQRGLRKRIDGWEIANGVSLKGAPLFIASSLPFLCDQANTQATLQILTETADKLFFESGTEPALIVIDTVARAMNGANENSTEDMGSFVASLDALRLAWGSTVLTVHHTGHDPEAQKRGRGSSNYGASLDSDFYLKVDDKLVCLTAGPKAKDWPKPPPVTLSKVEIEVEAIGEDGQPEKETTLTLHDAAGAVMATDKRERAAALREAGQTYREIAVQIGMSKSTVAAWQSAA